MTAVRVSSVELIHGASRAELLTVKFFGPLIRLAHRWGYRVA